MASEESCEVRFPVRDVRVGYSIYPELTESDYEEMDEDEIEDYYQSSAVKKRPLRLDSASLKLVARPDAGPHATFKLSLSWSDPTTSQSRGLYIEKAKYAPASGRIVFVPDFALGSNLGESGLGGYRLEYVSVSAPPQVTAALLRGFPNTALPLATVCAGLRQLAPPISASGAQSLSHYRTPFEEQRRELELARATPTAAYMTGAVRVPTRASILQDVLNPALTPLNPTTRNMILAECASIDAELDPYTRRQLFRAARELALQIPANATKRQLCTEVTAHLALANVVDPTLQRTLRTPAPSAGSQLDRSGKRKLQ